MKLTVDFSQLFMNVRKMGATSIVEIDLRKGEKLTTEFNTDITTSKGKEITLEELEITEGIFSYQDKQVLLFIPDHSFKYELAITDITQRNKFHLTDCSTLENMRNKGRFARYHITTNNSGYFEIHNNSGITEEVELQVCKNCLIKLNYKNYSNNKTKVFNEFNLEECFAYFRPYFRELPIYKNQDKPGYTSNWKQISENYRYSKNYCCESCNVNLSAYKHLLHTHHKDGNKQNNERGNLKAVCIECHSKEPDHQHLIIKLSDLTILSRLRKEQGVSIETDF
ncbi:hypothetical protein A6B43_06855 [Vespertiliibacter pulmonis]|uniref:HNH endonuclease n=1 Tax=Vespertiliibacter pulmonis TaxID=1443036 RepID=A0A3N4WIA0_9PAST|nr:HNH endonuclease signature motif containing protein [Vespertiliibacter pulmonis]QLB21255.1 hypothetical protein A6B43_06855 [Vespertiliibacter pulmonis]RPE85660.1 hypothetical protein EDC46_0038 [Vespertiliibacter pulmonis]